MKKMEKWYNRYRRNRNGLKFITVIFCLMAGLSIFFWQTHRAKADVTGNWGMASAKELNINSKVAGRVVELCVAEGDYVEKGQVIARIDTDTQKAQQRQAQASLAAQYAQLQQVVIASQSAAGTLEANLRAAEARVGQAQTGVNLAAREERRYRQLLSAEAVSQATYDTYRSKYEEAEAVLAAAQADVSSAQAALLKNQENKSLEQAAREQAEALQGQLDEVNVSLSETEIRAPFSGIITQKYVEEGALISGAVPLYALQDAQDNWVDFKVKETELAGFAVGDQVMMLGRDGEVQLKGTVESIRRKGDFATQKATSERGDVDMMSFNVKVRTNDERIWPGMRFRLMR